MTLSAPNGNPSNLSPEQWHLVRTPQFKAWFGDWEKLAMAKVKDPAMDEVTLSNLSKDVSKVLDMNGEPLAVYHGTRNRFWVFDRNKGGESNTLAKVGFWFTPKKIFAENFGMEAWWGKDDALVYQVFLNIKKLKIYSSDSKLTWGDSYEKFRTDVYKIEGKTEYDANIGGIGMMLKNANETINKYRGLLNDEGYDGIIIEQTRFDKTTAGGLNDQYVALYPEQIKLADGTNTTFDEESPDIRFEEGGKIDIPNLFYGERGVGALVYCTSTNRFLLLKRGDFVQEPNTWGMVSGKVDDTDEDLQYAISREVEEELDVVLNDFKPTYTFRKGNFTFQNFFAFVDEEFEPRLNWENQDYMWASLDEFPDDLHFGVQVLMQNVDLSTFEPNQEFADGGSVSRDAYSGREINKIYVSIRIKYDIGRKYGSIREYEIQSIDEKPFMELSNGVMEGVLGVSSSNYNLSEWLVHRECLIMMPFDEFKELNNTEQVNYYDSDYLTKNGLEPFFRLYDRKSNSDSEYLSVIRNIFPKISLELELESMVVKETNNVFYAMKALYDVYLSSKFLNFFAVQPRANSPEDFAKYTKLFLESGEAKKEYYYGYMPDTVDVNAILPAIRRGIVQSAKIYDTESEWLLLDKKLIVPQGSKLFFVQKGYDNQKTEYEKIMARWNIRSKYSVYYVKQNELDELQSVRFNQKDKEYQDFLQKSRSEIDKKIVKSLKSIQSTIIDGWTNNLRNEFVEYFDNQDFSDDDGNKYGTDIFNVPTVSTYYDSLVLRFIEIYDTQYDMFVKTKNKYIFSDIFNTFRDYLQILNQQEGSDYLEAYTSYQKVYKYHLLEKLRWWVNQEDVSKLGQMIKEYVGSDIYRYFQREEINFKVGGAV